MPTTERKIDHTQIADQRSFPLDLVLTDQLTVAAWVRADAHGAETPQTLVAQWQLATAFDAFSGFDAGRTDGLACKGYMGGVFDGRYIYFSPNRDGNDRESVHGRVLRYDTHGEFKDRASWAAYDLGMIHSHQGIAYDGRGVKLYVDGKLAAERGGSGKIQQSATAVTIGQLADGAAAFQGEIDEILIANTAHGDAWIKKAYRQKSAT